jgi:hypothetical protein
MPPSPCELMEFLFVTIARKPKAVPFRKGAAVARYLDNLIYQLPPGKERQLISRLAKAVWGQVFQFAKFKMSKRIETIQFLEAFSQTHLSMFDTATAINTVRSSSAPPDYRPRPILRSPNLGIATDRRLRDDLTERICAAYWALRLARIPNARRQVAEALTRRGIPTRSRTGDLSWTGFEVTERVKQYEAQVLARLSPDRKAARRALVEKWTMLYYPIPEVTESAKRLVSTQEKLSGKRPKPFQGPAPGS